MRRAAAPVSRWRQRAGRRPAAGRARPRRRAQCLRLTGRVSRIDVRLVPGTDREALLRAAAAGGRAAAAAGRIGAARLQRLARLPRQPHGAGAGGAVHRRLPGVLHPVAVGGAACAASGAARRAGPGPRAARLDAGRIGADRAGRQRARPALGTGLAALALRLLAGDLGGAFFPASRRACSSATAALVYGAARRGRPRGRRLAAGAPAPAIAAGPDPQGAGREPPRTARRGWARCCSRSACCWRRRRPWPASRWPPTPRWPACCSAASPLVPAAVALLLRPARRATPCAAGRAARATKAAPPSRCRAWWRAWRRGGADGDGGQLPRSRDAVAGRRAAGRPVRRAPRQAAATDTAWFDDALRVAQRGGLPGRGARRQRVAAIQLTRAAHGGAGGARGRRSGAAPAAAGRTAAGAGRDSVYVSEGRGGWLRRCAPARASSCRCPTDRRETPSCARLWRGATTRASTAP